MQPKVTNERELVLFLPSRKVDFSPVDNLVHAFLSPVISTLDHFLVYDVGLTTSTQSAVLKNTGAYPEGIIGSECSGGGKTPVT